MSPGDGLQSIALASDDRDADSAAVRARGGVADLKVVDQKSVQTAGRHPNGVQRIERVYIAATDLAAVVEKYSRVLDLAAPT